LGALDLILFCRLSQNAAAIACVDLYTHIHTLSHMCIYMDLIYIYLCGYLSVCLGGLKFFRAQNILSSELSTSVVNCYLTRYIGYRRIPTDLVLDLKYLQPTLCFYQKSFY